MAAGGTGGHLYPALAVARELKQRDAESEVIFAGTRRGLEGKVVPQAGYALEILNVDPLRGGSLFRKLKGLLQIGPAMFESLRLLRRVHPHVVMGVGGYVSGPLLAVAAVSGVPTLILEPNAEPGLTNRWLSPWVDAAALAWDETGRFFRGKGFVSGNPVREEITRVGSRPPGEVMHLLIFGGSQGSLALNRAMIEALPHIRSHRDLLRITHQTGEAGLAWVRTAYQEEGWTARVEAYLDAMAKEYGDCDLVVSRAGGDDVCGIGRRRAGGRSWFPCRSPEIISERTPRPWREQARPEWFYKKGSPARVWPTPFSISWKIALVANEWRRPRKNWRGRKRPA